MFLAVGAYTVAFLAPSVPEVLLLLPLAALLATALGLVIGLFLVRYRDIFFGMLNLALSMVHLFPAGEDLRHHPRHRRHPRRRPDLRRRQRWNGRCRNG